MLIVSLLPMLTRYSLTFDLIVGPDNIVTLTVIPRKASGAKQEPAPSELRPISLTGSAVEIDEELAKGENGALGQLITSRKCLADQLAEQREAADAERVAASAAAKAKTTAAKASSPQTAPKTTVATTPPADASADEPATLW